MTRIKHDDTLGGSKRKAQKQPARRARRSRPCKHKRYEVTRIDGSPLTEEWSPWKRECSDCGAQLLIGPSNDEPVAVQIELLATEVGQNPEVWQRYMDLDPEIEADLKRIGAGVALSTGSTSPDAGHAEMDPIPRWFDLNGYWSGWLAREIAAHGDLEVPDDADAWPWDPTRPVAGQYEEHNARVALASAAAEYERQRAAEPDMRDEDDEPETCTPASCAPSCPLRVRSDDPAPVESEIGGEA